MAIRIVIKDQDKIGSKQKKINKGQRDINGALCYVDWHDIKALKALTDELARKLSQLDLSEVRKELDKAYYASKRVADIDPPGCGNEFEVEPDKPAETKPGETNQSIKAA
jgi:hypothetical protein